MHFFGIIRDNAKKSHICFLQEVKKKQQKIIYVFVVL